MSLIKSVGAGEQSTGFYKHLLDQSLKFNDDESQYLTRTPASAGDRQKFTLSFWMKRGNLSSIQDPFSAGNSSTDRFEVMLTASDNLQVYMNNGGTIEQVTTTQVFRDVSAWYHIVLAFDTTDGTAANRLKVYVNGSQVTDFSTYDMSTVNFSTAVNSTSNQYISKRNYVDDRYFDGYMAEINLIDGTALTADSFGETKDGIWIPKDTSGLTFGGQGFRLTFKDDVVSEGFNAVTYRGTGADQSISGLGFEPDGLVWMKRRDTAVDHDWQDSVRGAGKTIMSQSSEAEINGSGSFGISSFDSDGFSIISSGGRTNTSGGSYVAWAWEAGGTPTADNSAGAGATPTAGSVKIDGSNLGSALAGSIAATRLSANTTKGFSIGTFTKGSGTETVAHGLGAAPDWLIVKRRNGTGSWIVYHSANTANPETDYLRLNNTNGTADEATFWNDTAPTSTVFTVGAAFNSGEELVFYAWTEISSYSKFSSYNGTGSSGNAVTGLGFEPAWLMIKRTDSAANWNIYDNTRTTTNPRNYVLSADTNSAESLVTGSAIDFDSDGFTLLGTAGTANASGGTYIYMAFADTREAAFFKDVSTNGNHWTPVNLDYRDSVPDVPTNNFATLNSLAKSQYASLSEGNLKIAWSNHASANLAANPSTITLPNSGKWYFELSNAQADGNNGIGIGICDATQIANGGNATPTNYYLYRSDAGNTFNGYYSDTGNAGSLTTFLGSSPVCGIAVDLDAGKFWAAVNNTWQGSGSPNPATGADAGFSSISTSVTWVPFVAGWEWTGSATTATVNFGQDSSFSGAKSTENANADENGHGSFAYAPPSGFLALCSQNLPTPTIVDGSEHFNTVLYTGNGSTQSITGVGFGSAPDFVWAKTRSPSGYGHALFDVVRGGNERLDSSATQEGRTNEGNISFQSDGFNVTSSHPTINNNTSPVVAWNWLAGTAFSNDASATSVGTIDSSGQVNTKAGFSIIGYTGNGTDGATVAHGLSQTIEALIVKRRNGSTAHWQYLDKNLSSGKVLLLSSTGAEASYSGFSGGGLDNLASATFSLEDGSSNGDNVNASGNDFIAYCFHSVEGYSKVGSYTGNGSSDGPFIYTGFRPAWIMIKNITDSGEDWEIHDATRDPFNVTTKRLKPNTSGAEVTATFLDFVSSGVKLRSTGGGYNASGKTFIYLAFAESPFKFSNAR